MDSTVRTPQRRARRIFARLVLPLAAWLGHCGEGGIEPSGPSIISPQPIPENSTGVRLDTTSVTAREVEGSLIVRAMATAPVPGTTSLTITNLNRDDAVSVVSVTLDEAFEVTLPGTLADTVRIEETRDVTLAVDLRFGPDGRGSLYEPCFAVENNARNVLLPAVPVGAKNAIKVMVENRCGEEIRVTGAHTIQSGTASTFDLSPVASHAFAPGVSTNVLIPFRAEAAGDISSLVVVRAERSVTAVRFRASTR